MGGSWPAGTAAIKKGLGTEVNGQVRKPALDEGSMGGEARWHAHSGSVSDADRKPLEGFCGVGWGTEGTLQHLSMWHITGT